MDYKRHYDNLMFTRLEMKISRIQEKKQGFFSKVLSLVRGESTVKN